MKTITITIFLLLSLVGTAQHLYFSDVHLFDVDKEGHVLSHSFPYTNIELKVEDSLIHYTEINSCGTIVDERTYTVIKREYENKFNYYTAELDGVTYEIGLPTKNKWMISIEEIGNPRVRLISARNKYLVKGEN
ncbi:hypothetical protein [Brumimicrobium mesophilum]|uniref:hypothetical protein n=1 Tax=Brumimicrobium mesophilum TaxID=392717 RepID=UPI000D1431A1|nr:hypothetical protein [Brumimicrobium mesophilum]